jgi:site-specific DNA recombinase
MTRSASYSRISKTSEKFDKVAEQTVACRDRSLDDGNGEPVAFEDDGISATKGKVREGFDALIERVTKGEFDVIYVKEQSRFERSPLDRERLAVACAATSTRWFSLTEGEIDPNGADSGFMSIIRSAVNSNESKRNSTRTRFRNELKIGGSKPIVTRRPFGFEDDGVTIRESEAALIRSATEDVISGHPINYVFKQWKASGLTPVISRGELALADEEGREPEARQWQPSSVTNILRRPRNAGHIVHRGEIAIRDAFDPIVKPERWDILESILSDEKRSVTRSRELKYMLSGVAICGTCGHVMRPTTVNSYPVYRCGSVAPRGAEKHPMVMTHIADDRAAQAVARYFLTATANDGAPASDAGRIQTELAEVRAQKERLTDLAMTTPGFEAQFRKRSAELVAREQKLQLALDAVVRENATALLEVESRRALWTRLDHVAPLSEAVEARQAIQERFKEMPVHERRAIVRSIIRLTVNIGRGADRITIEPLSEDEWDERDREDVA